MADRSEVMRSYAHGVRQRQRRPELQRGLLVGQAPPKPKEGKRHEPLFPFPRNCAGERLWRMSGLSLDDYMEMFDRVNTLSYFPGRSGKGDAFPLKEAREAASSRVEELNMLARPCLFVGKANAQCYPWAGELPPALTFQVQPAGAPWAWLPHTSGIVQYWNEAVNRKAVAALFGQMREKIMDDRQKKLLTPLDLSPRT